MAISDNYVPLRQIGNGVTTQFSGAWAIIAPVYAQVFLEDAITGVQTPVPAGAGAGQYQLVFNNSGFTITFGTPPTSGQYAVIGRDVAFDQTDPYRTSKGFQGEVVEASFDKLTAIAQDLNDGVKRSLTFPLGDTASTVLPSALLRANLFIGFDSLGNVIVGAAASAVVSAAMIPVVQALTLPLARAALGAAASGANADITSLAGLTSINGGPLGGFRNAVINGDFKVWQRGSTGFTPGNTTLTYTADRWAVNQASSSNTFCNRVSTITPGLGFQYNLQFGRNAGATTTGQMSLCQAFETANSIPFAGKTVALSFWAKAGANYSGASNNISAIIMQGTGVDQSVTLMNSGSWTGFASAPFNPVLTTSWQKFTFFAPIASSITQLGVQFNYNPLGTAGGDDSFSVTGVQLEICDPTNHSATPFENRGIGVELALCQRHYEKSFAYGTTPIQNAGVSSGEAMGIASKAGATGSAAFIFVTYKVKKRGIPGLILFYNPAAANSQLRDESNSVDFSSSGLLNNNENGFVASGTGNSSTTVGSLIGLHWSSDAEL